MFSGVSFGKKPSRKYTEEEDGERDSKTLAPVVSEKVAPVRDEWMTNVAYQDDMDAARREAHAQAAIARNKREHGRSGYKETLLASAALPGGNPAGGQFIPEGNVESSINSQSNSTTVVGDGGASWNQRRLNYAADESGVYVGVKKKGDRGVSNDFNERKLKLKEEEERVRARMESDKRVTERRKQFGEQQASSSNSSTTTPLNTNQLEQDSILLPIPSQQEITSQLSSIAKLTDQDVISTDMRKLTLSQVYAQKQRQESEWSIVPMPLDEKLLPGMPVPTKYSDLPENEREVMMKLAKTIRYIRKNGSLELRNQLRDTAVIRESRQVPVFDANSLAALQQDAKRNVDKEFLKMHNKAKDGEAKDGLTSAVKEARGAGQDKAALKCRFCEYKWTYRRESLNGSFVRVLVPEKPLTPEHVVIVPKEHLASQAGLDEETRADMELAKKVVSRSLERIGLVAVFFETCVCRNLRSATKQYSGAGFGHCVVHALGLTPKQCIELAGMVRGELQQATDTVTTLTSLSKRGLRGSLPRDGEISYLSVEFGLDPVRGGRCGDRARYGLLGPSDLPRKAITVASNATLERSNVGTWSEAGYDQAFTQDHERLVASISSNRGGNSSSSNNVHKNNAVKYEMLGDFVPDEDNNTDNKQQEEHGRFGPGYLQAIEDTRFPQDIVIRCVAAILHLDVMFQSSREVEEDKQVLEESRSARRDVYRPYKEQLERNNNSNRDQNPRDRTYSK